MIPWLLLGATLLFAAGPWLQRKLSVRSNGATSSGFALIALAAVCLYGGYFNGGLGILLLAVLGLLGESNLNTMNGIKSLVSAVLTAISVVVYAAGGLIAWPLALTMVCGAVAGAYVGARVIRRVPDRIVRGVIFATGLFMTAWFFVRS